MHGRTSDPRMKGLAVLAVGASAYNTYQGIQGSDGGIDTDKASSLSLDILMGSSSGQTKTDFDSTQTFGSNLTAGGNIFLNAHGAGKDSTLTVQGSNIQAGNKTSLKAEGNIDLAAGDNSANQHSTNSASSYGYGVTFSSDCNICFKVTGSAARGNADGEDTSHTQTHIRGKEVELVSGKDTNIVGAVVSGDQVSAKVGGNLNILSLQDTSKYDAKQESISGSVAIGYGQFSASATASTAKVNGDFKSVTQQSGIHAGDGGFQVAVKGDTSLQGGVISSSDKAVTDKKNSFTTDGKLTISDIQNTDSYSADAVSVSISGSRSGGVNGGGAGVGHAGDSKSSTTQSGISGIAGNQNIRTGDAETGLQKSWSGSTLMADVQAQAQIVKAASSEGFRAWGTFSNNKQTEAQINANKAHESLDGRFGGKTEAEWIAEADKWDEGGIYRIVGHIVIGGGVGGVNGAVGAGVSQAALPSVAEALINAGVPIEALPSMLVFAGIGLGAISGGEQGAISAGNATVNNYVVFIARVAGYGQTLASSGWAALSAEAQASLQACMRATWCANMLAAIPAFATAWAIAPKIEPPLSSSCLIPPASCMQISPGVFAPIGTPIPPATKPGDTNTGGNQIAPQQPNNTGGNQIVTPEPGASTTGGNQIVTPKPGDNNTGGNQIAPPSNPIVMNVPPSILDPTTGALPPGIGGLGTPIPMPPSGDPDVSAEQFARNAFNGQTPLQISPINGSPGSWVAAMPDGTYITYRPAGQASSATDSGTATVEINSPSVKSINNGKPAKFKFPGL